MFEKGQIIRVAIARRLDFGPEHYGVYDGYGWVYHFTGRDFDSARIVYTSLQEFADGGKVYVDSSVKAKYSSDEIVQRASSKLGTAFGGYDLLSNNCEHFASWCVSGVRQSIQTGHVNPEDDERDIVEKYIDETFEPFIQAGDKIDKVLKIGDYKDPDDNRDLVERGIDAAFKPLIAVGDFIDNIFKR